MKSRNSWSTPGPMTLASVNDHCPTSAPFDRARTAAPNDGDRCPDVRTERHVGGC
jgi:hypothetical protein